MTRDDWKYLAGLFDGEGSVTVALVVRASDTKSCKKGARALNMSLRIANNDPRVLLWLEENFGGTVRSHGPHRPNAFVWICQGDKSVEAAQNLARYSRMKRDQLEHYIALMALRGRGGVRVSEEDWHARIELIDAIRSAPYRGGLRLVKSGRPT